MELFRLGKITSPVGIKGEMRVYSYLDELTRFSDIEEVLLDGRRVKLERVRFQKDMAVVKLAGIDDRNTSELMRGKELFIEKSELDLGDDTYFTDELVGCRVVDEKDVELGTLAEVLANPAHDLYRIEKADGSSFLMPAVKAFITSAEPENRLIRVSLPEGLTSL